VVTEVWSPDQIETAIREVSGRISKGVSVCDERYRAYLTADHAYGVGLPGSRTPVHRRTGHPGAAA
jgi:hypothetical protein